MDKNFYLSYIDELTHEERSIFLYRFILKLPNDETARRLKLSNKKIKDTYKMLQEQKELLFIKADLLEAFRLTV